MAPEFGLQELRKTLYLGDEFSQQIWFKQGLWTHKILFTLRIYSTQNDRKTTNLTKTGVQSSIRLFLLLGLDYLAANLLHVLTRATWPEEAEVTQIVWVNIYPLRIPTAPRKKCKKNQPVSTKLYFL